MIPEATETRKGQRPVPSNIIHQKIRENTQNAHRTIGTQTKTKKNDNTRRDRSVWECAV